MIEDFQALSWERQLKRLPERGHYHESGMPDWKTRILIGAQKPVLELEKAGLSKCASIMRDMHFARVAECPCILMSSTPNAAS